MRYFWRVFFILLGIALLLGAVLVVMFVISGQQGDLYNNRVKVAFHAATLSYTAGDSMRTVVVTYEGDSFELDPDAYRALSFYMRLGATKAFFPRATDGERISVVICGTDTADIYRISADDAYVIFHCANGTMKVTIRADGLWENLVHAAMRAEDLHSRGE